MASKTKKTTSKEVKAKQKAKADAPKPAAPRPAGYVGKIQGTDSEDGPTITGTDVLVAEVLNDLDMGDTIETVCKAWGIASEDVAACKAWRDKPEAERGAECTPASEPPNPDEPRELPPRPPIESRKVELSTVVPGKPVVLERMQRTLLVSLTEAELDAKRREVFVASRTLRDAADKLLAVKSEIKRVTEHERELHAIIDRGQEDRSVPCERVLEGTMANLYRVDRLERIDTRAAMQHERQLTIGGVE